MVWYACSCANIQFGNWKCVAFKTPQDADKYCLETYPKDSSNITTLLYVRSGYFFPKYVTEGILKYQLSKWIKVDVLNKV